MSRPPPKERRKPDEARKESQIRILVTAEQKRVLGEAAERAGLELSAWLRNLGLRAAGEDRSMPRAKNGTDG